MTTTDYATRSAVEIDTRLSEVYSAHSRLSNERDRLIDTVEQIIEAQKTYERNFSWNSPERLKASETRLDVVVTETDSFLAEALSLEALYTGWTRYYWVTNSNGHIHSSTACASCFPTTQYAWMTEYSGSTHEALVEVAGEAACTVCFPDAPVDVLSCKTRLEEPEKRARREEREAKAAAKAAAEIRVEGYVDHSNSITKTFKSERAATNDIAQHLTSLACWSHNHPSAGEWASNVEVIIAALAARGVTFDLDAAKVKAAKRART